MVILRLYLTLKDLYEKYAKISLKNGSIIYIVKSILFVNKTNHIELNVDKVIYSLKISLFNSFRAPKLNIKISLFIKINSIA